MMFFVFGTLWYVAWSTSQQLILFDEIAIR
jgi:hypothetical protein